MQPGWRTTARQDRSRATDRRIVAAAMDLIGKHGFDDLPVAAIARRARVSIGGLYARYRDKLALVHAVDERLVATFEAVLARAMAKERLADLDLAAVITVYVDTMVTYFARHRDLVRQVVLRARSTGDPEFSARIRAFNQRAHGLLIEALLARRDAIGHPDPTAATAFGVSLVSAAAREAVLFGEEPVRRNSARGRLLVNELVRAYCGYLGTSISSNRP
ncbi:MAG: TetR/AcrR family transcriptional regulator [Planctomycetes bacterium]|nr:TetR/AcrR family transcriptional regulator [Planctomycetota bacterium]